MRWTERVDAANLLAREGKGEEADQAFVEAMALHPDEQWISFHYARRAFLSHDWETAKFRCDAYLQRFGPRPQIAGLGAQVLLRLGREEQAEALLEDAMAKFGVNAEMLEAKARIDEKKFRWDSAIAHWEAYVAATRKDGPPALPASIPPIHFADFITIFGYFTGSRWAITPNMMFWKHVIGDRYRVLDDEEVGAIISRRRPSFRATYDAIRIPACRADVARLVYLEDHGGLYADMHCTMGALDHFSRLPEDYDRLDACFFTYDNGKKRSFGNSIIMARPGAAVITEALDQAVDNLERHRAAEAAASEYVPYNILTLCGPAMIRKVVCEPDTFDVAARHGSRVMNRIIRPIRADTPILPFSRYTYRSKGQHWSERQKVEPLFERR